MDKVTLSRPGLERPNLEKPNVDKTEAAENDGLKAAASKKPTAIEDQINGPDYVVKISTEKLDENSTYTAAEIKAKAKELLMAGDLTTEEKNTLGEILAKGD